MLDRAGNAGNVDGADCKGRALQPMGGLSAKRALSFDDLFRDLARLAREKLQHFYFQCLVTHRLCRKVGEVDRLLADCGLVVDPDAAGLADIAVTSARSFEALAAKPAKVAMLSFSTAGSAAHERVSKVVEATRIAHAAAPGLVIDGELQFDTAFVEAVSASKAPQSALHGEANVFVFPNLDAANIGYKIAQRIGGATAIGPILQGLAKPANDLSRGCNVADVFHMIAVTVVQASGGKSSG